MLLGKWQPICMPAEHEIDWKCIFIHNPLLNLKNKSMCSMLIHMFSLLLSLPLSLILPFPSYLIYSPHSLLRSPHHLDLAAFNHEHRSVTGGQWGCLTYDHLCHSHLGVQPWTGSMWAWWKWGQGASEHRTPPEVSKAPSPAHRSGLEGGASPARDWDLAKDYSRESERAYTVCAAGQPQQARGCSSGAAKGKRLCLKPQIKLLHAVGQVLLHMRYMEVCHLTLFHFSYWLFFILLGHCALDSACYSAVQLRSTQNHTQNPAGKLHSLVHETEY